ncbi:MAG TPA: PQQ-binding-like beta-propeller repeat protein [Spirochaetota bacterium]|nr:PQQ-binding-like beta-propeller repeat protein [Spirochaetota bacterium]
MIEAKQEIKSIIESFSGKKKFRGMNARKLADLFDRAVLDYPEQEKPEALSSELIPGRLKGHDSVSAVRRMAVSFPRPALAAGIAAVVLAVFAFGIRAMFFTGPVSGSAVTSTHGTVTLLRDGNSVDLSEDSGLMQGDIVISGNKSRVDMNFGGLVRVRMAENSTLSVETMSLGSERTAVFSLDRGSACVHVMKLAAGDDVRFNTPVSVGLVKGTLFGVEYAGGRARYEVYEGKVLVSRKMRGAAVQSAPGAGEKSAVLAAGTWGRVRSGSLVHSGGEPAARKSGSRNFAMSAAMLDFVIDSGKTDRGFDVIPVRFEVSPAEATIAVDGTRIAHGIAFLSKGKHRIEAGAEGYLKLAMDITAKSPMQTVPVMLGKGKNPMVSWSSHLQSSYIHFDSASNHLVTVDDQGLVAVTDLKSVKWSIDFDKKISGPPYEVDGCIYISFADGSLALYDYTRGSLVWNKKLDSPVPGNRGMVQGLKGVFALTEKGTLYRIDRTGNVIWRVFHGTPAKVQPVFRGNTVFIALKKGWLLGINADTGAEKRKVFLDEEISSMSLSNDAVYISTSSGNVYNYNYGNDGIQWSTSSRVKGASIVRVDEKAVYVFYRSGHIMRLNLSGRLVWERDLGGELFITPAEDAAHLYFSGSNNLFVVSKETGEVQWSIVVPSVLTGTVALSKDKMFMVSSSKGLMILNKF